MEGQTAKTKRKYVIDDCTECGVLQIDFFFEGEVMDCKVDFIRDCKLHSRILCTNASQRKDAANENRLNMKVNY